MSDLVRDRRAELGLSLRKLADLCIDPEDPGEPLWKFAVINRLERHLPVIPPQLPELRALAAGLSLPLWKVQGAAGAQFFGIDTVWSDAVRALVQDYESMPPDDQKRARQLMRAWGAESTPESDSQ
ncbi:XRE family transcriptional regulator [Streptomyces sp. NPDC059883]|uniref:XRE family transcriptional regulator n=1 Tax=unclassified Streptomyces TaxID=2593676 RepID=UPI0036663215